MSEEKYRIVVSTEQVDDPISEPAEERRFFEDDSDAAKKRCRELVAAGVRDRERAYVEKLIDVGRWKEIYRCENQDGQAVERPVAD